MILVIGPNLAVDIVMTVPSPRLASLNHARSASFAPAGKGMNVARALSLLGCPARLHGFVGQAEHSSFTSALEKTGASFDLTPLPGTTRMNRKIVDDGTGDVTEFDMPGLTVSKSELLFFEETWKAQIGTTDWLVLTGSLPQGVPANTYGRWIDEARKSKLPVALDTGGERLARALPAGPTLVKVNWAEMESVAEGPVSGDEEAFDVLRSWHDTGVEYACVTRRDALLLSTPRGRLKALVPAQAVANPVGAGDAALAGFLAALAGGRGDRDALLEAAATAAASVRTETPGHFIPEDRNRILPQVEIHPVS